MKQIEIVGAAIVDVVVSPADRAVFDIGSCPAQQILMTYGGDALNEATVLQKLGAPVRLRTLLGQDAAGDSVLRRMEDVGLDRSAVTLREGLATSVNVVLVQADGERAFLTNPHGSQRQLTLAEIPLPFPEDVEILSFASMFVFPKMGASEMEAVFRQAKAQGITVCADMTKRKNGETAADIAPALRYVDYLLPNDAEAMLLTGADTVEEAARQLQEAGAATVIVKCGKKGCYTRTPEDAFWTEAEADVTCVDTTGAGDSFAAGFLFGLADGQPLTACLRLANRCGARAVEQVGATAWIAP